MGEGTPDSGPRNQYAIALPSPQWIRRSSASLYDQVVPSAAVCSSKGS